MRDLDAAIDEAINAEERELLRKVGEEPGYVQQALGLFEGRTGWVNSVLMIAQGAAFVMGAWAAWNFFAADQVLAALRWGLSAATLLLMSLTMKMALWPVIQANRIIRELKRLELRIATRHGA
jgi:hypothetical protein